MFKEQARDVELMLQKRLRMQCDLPIYFSTASTAYRYLLSHTIKSIHPFVSGKSKQHDGRDARTQQARWWLTKRRQPE